MNDIYDEDREMCQTQAIVAKLTDQYTQYVGGVVDDVDVDVRRRRTQLAIKPLDQELIRQIVYDAAELMTIYNIDPSTVRW
jgi:hypothetical protein